MIDPKAEPIDNRSPYKRIDLAARRRKVCPECGAENPPTWLDHALGCSSTDAQPVY